MKAFQKSIDNVRITCPIIYHTQEKSSESFHAYSEATFDYSTTEPNQKIVGLSSLIDILHEKVSKKIPKLQMQLYHARLMHHARISGITDRITAKIE